MMMDVTGKPEDSTSEIHLYGKLTAAFQRPASTFTKLFKIFVVSTSAAGLIACTPTAPEFEDIGSSTYAKPTTDQELYLISDLTSNSPAISGSCDDNTVSIGMKPDGQEAWDEVATSSLDPSSDLNCIDGNFSLVISQAGTYMGFTLSLAEQKKIHIKTTGANGDSAETEAMIRYLPVIPVIDVVDISPSSNEGETATLRLTIYPQATFGAVFNYQTLDISAAAGSDYTSASGSVSFGTGDDFLDIPVVIATDSLFEADETFKVSLDSVAGANFGSSEATVTIPTNGTPPSIFIGNATGSEGDTLTFTISINAVSGVNATFNVDSFGGTAGSGTDFTAISTSGSIPAGSLTATVDVVTTEETAYESDETFTVSLSSVVNASVGIAGSDDVGTGTIQNDDTQVNIYLTAPAPSAEGGDHVFTVSVSATSVFNVTYAFDTYDGTATTADTDYTALSGMTGTLMAGDLSQTITVVSGNDSTFENDETVVLSLSSVLGAIVGTPGTDDMATATILNNDSGPSLFIDDLSLNEGVSGALSVSLDSTSGIDAVFTWQTFDGSALASNSDYTSVGPVQITIPSGSLTTGLVYVEALGDSLDEANENLTITLAVLTGAGTGDLSSDITINDQNGPPNVFISDSAEPESNSLAFLVSLDVVSGQDVAFSYQSYDGTATTGDSDYSAVSGTATIPALQGRITLSVSVTDDNKFEINEFMSVTISSPVNGVISDNTGIGTLQNNDTAPQLFIGDSAVTEGQTLAFVVSIAAVSGVDMSFDYQTYDGNTGTVTLNALVGDSDYSALSGTTTIAPGDLSVTLLSVAPQDTKLEGDEQMTVSLDNISGATIVAAGSDDVATGTISNDDAFPFIYSDDLTYGEGSTGQHVVSLSEVSGLPVEYSYSVYNGSVIGADYNVVSDSTLTIAAGSTTSSVDIDALVDGLDEDNETYTLSLHSLLAAQDGDLEAAGTITDGDPTPSIYITDENISEPGTSTVTVSLSEASGREISFSYQSFATGSATGGGTDYNDVALTVATISAGVTSFTFSVEAVGDVLSEGNEVFDVSLSGLNNVNPGDISGTMTILDDDGPPNLTVYPVEVTEGSSGIAIASLSATSGLNVTFDWQTYDIPGEALAGSDYTAQASVEYTIAAGQLTVGLTISATNDSPLDEEDYELLMVSLSNLSNANFAVSIATVSISDADTPPDIFVANAAGVTEGSTLQFSITLSKISGRDVIVDWQTVDGVASVASGDYTAVSSQLATFSPGTGTITAEVRTLDDSLDEAVESVLVSLTSATSGNISDPSGSGDINDDDPLVQILAFDAQATEGTSAVVTISLNTASGRHVSFDFDLQDGSATSGSGDYPAGSGTLTIYTSDTFMLLTIPTSADASFESDEVFHISLSNPVAATFADDFADITLINGNAPPGIYVSDAAGPITEGANADFVVSLSGVSGLDVTFDYETYDDTALGAYDFTAIGTTEATIPAGQLNITLSVNTTDDLRDDSAENEFFGITITSPTNGNISVASGQVMIQDNDLAPNLYVVDLGGNEGETLSVLVSLSEESERNVTFDYETFDGSATVTADFLGRNESGAQFAPYTTSLSVAVTLVADSIYEGNDETFLLSLTPSTDAGVGGDLVATLTVTNTTALPQLFAVNSASVTEGTTAEFLVTMSGQASTDVTFLWSTIDGWAQDSGIFIDYVGVTNKIVTISPLSTGVTLATDTNDDAIGEPAENFFVTLTGASANATIVGSSAQITLNDNDGGVYLMVYGDTQDEGADLVFTVSKSSNQLADVTFNVETFDGTAISLSGDNDYTGISRTGTIAGGLVTFDMIATFTISTGNDTKLESNETFVLSISSISNASVASAGDAFATGTINNNDFQPMLFVDNLNLNEGETQVLSVSLSEVSGLNSIFNWETFNGSAAEGAGDYTQVTTTQVTIPAGSVTTHLVSFSALSDGLDEFDEYAYVSLTAGLNVSVGNDGVDNLATVTIVDQDPAPSIHVGNVTILEGSVGDVIVTLSAVSDKDVWFNYSSQVTGTALGGGVDYNNFSGNNVTIPAQQISITLSGPNAVNDSVYEGDESYAVQISGVNNAGAGSFVGQVTIEDTDPVPGLVVYDTTVTENVTIDFLVSMSSENSTNVSFDFATFDGTAVQPADYLTLTSRYTIPSGSLQVTISVTTWSDTLYEADETLQVSLSNPSANVTITSGVATGTLNDNDAMPNLFIDDNLSINEGDTGEFVISLSALSGLDAVFSWETYTISGQAEAGDFTIVNATTGTIPAGASAVTVSVFTSQDVLDEANESFLVSLTTVADVGYSVASDLLATGTIIDDDGTPNIFATDITITEGDATYMTVSLAATLGYDVTFDFATVDIGSAVTGADFGPMVGGQMTISAGDLTVGVTVATPDLDTNYELDEVFHVTISNVSNGAAGKLFGVVTIFDNDPMPTISISNGGGNEESIIALDVTLSAQSAVNSVFSVALYDETATAGSGDYLATTGPFTLTSFSSNGTVTIATGTDTLFELNETFLVSLHSFSNVTIVTAGVSDLGQATIVNNDAAPTIYIDPVSVNEGETAILPVSLSAVSGLDVVFDWITIDGLTPTLAARSGDLDYFGNGDSSVTIPEGSLTLGLSVITRTDTLDEYDEYFRVSLSSVVNAVGGALDARVTIVDQNSEPQLFISDSAPTLEGATAHFTVSLDATSEKLVTFDYQTFDGTADGADYGVIGLSQGSIPAGSSTFGIAVSITADSVFELTEMFSVSLSNAVHAAIVDDTGLGPIYQAGSLNISIVESSTGFAAEEVEGTPLVVTVTLSSPAQFTVTFDYNLIEISATSADGDYTLPPQLTGVTIGPGFTTDTLTIFTGNDTKFEGDEILRVSLSNHPLAVAALTSDINKQLAIQNNDISPELKIDPISAVEGQSANISISLTEVSGFNVTFAFYTNQTGSAVSGLDYYGFNGNLTVVIPAGSTTVPADSVTVAHFDDTEFEGGSGTYETYEVSLMPLFSGAAYFDPATTISIEDNDSPASLYVGDVGLLTEGDTFPFVVSLSSTPGQDVVFEWSILDGSASVAAGDFTGVTMATATIPNGDLSVTISVISTDDLEFETTENFSITVTSLSANAAGVDLDGGGAIFNNDTLSIEFTTSAQSVDEMNGTQPEFRQVVAAGYSHTCALGRDKRSYCWGSNSDKELGFSGVFSLSAPGASSAGDSNGIYRQIGTGWGSTCALGEDQRIYCWGDGLNGRLGVGSSVSNVDAPRQVSLGGSPGTFIKLASGEQFNCAIATNDRLYCWGYNANGQLGDSNAPTSGLSPGLVDSTNGLTTVRDIAAGLNHACALSLDGAAYCWGQGNDGELGDGGTTDSPIPVAVDTTGIPIDLFKQISVGRDFSCAIGTDDQAYCWGRNNYGQLGDNNISVPSSVPVLVNSGAGPGTYKSLSLGANHACAVGTDDIPYCWGFGSAYRLGNGSVANQPDPVQVSSGEGPSTYKMIDGGLAHSCGVGTDDNIYCWGGGSYGRLGNGSVTVVEVPAQVLEGENTGAAWAEPLVELETILRLTGYYYNDVTLPLTVGGTASNPSDHTAVSGTLTIPSYKTSYSYQYDVVNDGVVEGSETVLFTLGAPSVGSLGAMSSHTATILDDDVGPTIVGVIPPADDTYGDGSSLIFTVTFSELVNVTGSPRLPLSVGASTRYADYSGGSGSAQWTFTYTPSNPDTDSDGIAYVDESTLIDFNGGNISDSDGNALDIDASGLGLPAMAGVLVDTTGPVLTIDRISPANTNVNLITFTFQFDEEIEPSTFTSTDLVISGSAGASFNSINTQIANNLFYVVLNASTDGTVQIGINPGSVDDEAGNPLNSVVISNDTVTYDASPPNITGITAPPGIYTSGNLNFTVNFDENVIESATNSDLTVSLDGSTYTANYLSGSGSSSFQYQLSIPPNVEEYGGMQLISPLQTGGDTLADAATNNADLTFIDPGFGNITIDSQAPTITDWAPPADGTYSSGQVLAFTVTFSENVTVSGPAQIQFTMDTGARNANYDTGSGTNVLRFAYTVTGGDADADGITIPVSQISVGGSITDAAGNSVASNALPVKNTSGILVGAPDILFLDGSGAAGGSFLGGVSITSCGGDGICGMASPYVLSMSGTFASVSLVNGAVMTTGEYSGGAVSINNGLLDLDVQDTLYVGIGSVISMSGRGYPMENGSGAGSNHTAASGGGGHASGGGSSGYSTPVSGGPSYGDVTISNMGSGSGRVANGSYGARGGGIIEISVGNLLDIDGEIRVDGERGQGTGTYASGGGAGGSILIDTVSLSGSGDLYARGGMGHTAGAAYGGGGSGGRIIIFYEQDIGGALDRVRPIMTGGGSLGLRAHGEMGGIAGREKVGGAGTIFYDDTDDANGAYLWVDNNSMETEWFTKVKSNLDLDILEVSARSRFEITAGTTLTAQEYEISNTSYFKHSGHLASPNAQAVRFDFNWTWDGGTIQGVIPGGYVTIPDNFTMTFTDHTLNVESFVMDSAFGNVLTHEQNTGSTFYRVDIEANSIIEIGGTIDVSGKGNPGGASYLPGTPPNLGSGADGGNAGGSYGGHGGRGTHGNPDKTNFGDIFGGLTLGAGGGDAGPAKGGAGGGYVRLVSNTSWVDLVGSYIYINGENGQVTTVNGDDYVGGSGSGGGLEVIGYDIYMDNTSDIELYGGLAQVRNSVWGGAGGGGRVYYEYDNYGDYAQMLAYTYPRIQNNGDEDTRGAPGVIVLQDNLTPDTWIDVDSNGYFTNAETPLYSPLFPTITLTQLNMWNGGNVLIPSGQTMILDPDSELYINNFSIDPSIIVEGEWTNQLSQIGYDLVIRNPAATAVNIGPVFTVSSTGLLEIDHNQFIDWSGVDFTLDGVMTHSRITGNTVDKMINIRVTDFTVGSFGKISVVGKGFGPGIGLGAGQNAYTNNTSGGGGGHGGGGGDSAEGMAGGIENDNAFAPTLAGSGGGGRFDGSNNSYPDTFGHGGGLVLLDVLNNLFIGGQIDASGADVGNPYTTAGYGGGAGGSISISVGGTFSGFNGYVYADGADCMGGCMSQGGGGGGRIVLPMEDSGSIYVYANGGVTSNFFNGEPGSIYRGPAQLNIQTPYTTMSEPTSLAGIAVTLTHAVPYDVTLSVNRTLGTAEDEDFFLHTNTIIISEGQTGGMILVDILDDSIWEGTGAEDVFDISFGWNAPAQVISGAITNSVNITITDNESDVIVYAPTSYLLDEGTSNYPVILSLSHLSEAPVNVGYSFSNFNISDGPDYTVVPGPGTVAVTFNPLELTQQLLVSVNNNAYVGQQYFSMDYSIPGAGTPISLIDVGSTTIHVNDDDSASGEVYLLDTVAVEGDQMIFTVTWTGSLPGGGGNTIQLNLSSGTAVTPGDFNLTVVPASHSVTGPEKGGPGFKTFTVQTNPDAISESNEYFTAQIFCSGGPSPGAWNSGAKPTAVGTILDQPTIEFEQIWMPVAEGGTAIYVTVETSTGAPLSRSVSFDIVNYSGTAQVGTDYILPASTNFELPINASSMSIPVQLVDNDLFEFDETFSLSLSNISGGMAGGLTVLTITIANDDPLDVEPQFPINGRNWNDYVKRDSVQAHWFDSSDTACDPDAYDGAGGYSNCIHGGEAKVVRTGIDSCTDLKVDDEKGAFTWHCDTSASGYADFYTFGLNDGIGLRDLIEGAGTPYLSSLTVSIVGSLPQEYGIATQSARWSNPVISINTKGSEPTHCVDFDVQGGIYYTNTQLNCIGAIKNDKVAVVTGKSGMLRWNNSGGPKLCEGSFPGNWCVISANDKDFLWIEATADAARDRNQNNNSTYRAHASLHLEQTKFSVIRKSSLRGAFYHSFRLKDSSNVLVKDSRIADQTGAGPFDAGLFVDGSSFNQFEGLSVNNTKGSGILFRNFSQKNVFVKNMVTGSQNSGVQLTGGLNVDNTFKDMTIVNSGDSGIFMDQADNNRFYSIVIVNTDNDGLSLRNESDNNEFTNLSIYRTDDGGSRNKVDMENSDNNLFFGDILFDSGTGLCSVTTSAGAGLDDNCDPAGASSFTVNGGLDLSGTFVGHVTIDSPNPEVASTLVSLQYTQIDQPGAWSAFENNLRAWGRVGNYTSIVPQGFCGFSTAEYCQINDWNLTDTDIQLKYATPKVVAGANCPAAFNGGSGDVSKLDTDNASNTFLVEAEEIRGDGVGDDDGLCESNERCVQISNRGADQDEESREFGGSCTFTNGTITGVELLSLASWDVFDNTQIGPSWSLSDGDTGGTSGSNSANNIRSKTGQSSGKYYVEFVVTIAGAGLDTFGVGLGESVVANNEAPTGRNDMLMYYDSGSVYDESTTSNNFSTDYNFRAPNTVVGLAIDLDATPTRVWISVNGQYLNGTGTSWSSSTPHSSHFRDINNSGDLYLFVSGNAFANGSTVKARFSPADHQYSAPAGYTAGWPGQ